MKVLGCGKLRLRHVPLAVALFFSVWIAGAFMSRVLRQAPYSPSPTCMKGLSFSMLLPGGGQVTIRAQKMSAADQRMGKAVFTLFKEVVFSHVKVTIEGGAVANIFDWATFDRLAPLAACVVPDMAQQDNVYLAGAKILLRDVEVSVHGDKGRDAKARMVADSLCLGANSDDAVLGGRLDLKIGSREHVHSAAGGVWSPVQHSIRFSRGFWLNGRTENEGVFALAKGDKSGNKLAGLFTGGHTPTVKLGQIELPDQVEGNGQHLVMKKKFFKRIRSMEKSKAEAFLFQYLALNPNAMKQNGLSPGRVLAPNFKLGAFDPGPFFGGTLNVPGAKPGRKNLWRNAVDLGKGWKYLRFFGYFYTNSSKWIYHSTLGWLLPYGTATSNVTFYDAKMKAFWWTNQWAYPWLYSFSEAAWLCYDPTRTGARWFYNSKTGKWETH